MTPVLAVVSPLTPGASTCGYCGPPGKRSAGRTSIHAAELIPMDCSCLAYQMMIDRGWRRSGTYCYKPNLKASCCPQYTIKLDALAFRASKSQRKLLNRFNRWILHDDDLEGRKNVHKQAFKASKNGEFILSDAIHACEFRLHVEDEPAHKFEVTLEPSSYTSEKFALYCKYQHEVHQEQDEKAPTSFRRFLVESPLKREAIPYSQEPTGHLPREYGAYHQLYRIDGELAAMGVIDILPSCISSVYFMYDAKWENFSLGKLSALREVALAKEMHDAGTTDMQYLYMGFYIHSCQKMRYKGEYAPSYLLDPEEYTWHPLEQCKIQLDKFRYATFAHPERSLPGAYDGPAPQPSLPSAWLNELLLLVGGEDGRPALTHVIDADDWDDPHAKQAITTSAYGLGPGLSKQVVFYLAHTLI